MLSTAEIVISMKQTSTDDHAEDNDDTGDPLPGITTSQAWTAFTDIQSYLLRGGSSAYNLIRDLEIEIAKAKNNQQRQTLITDFLL